MPLRHMTYCQAACAAKRQDERETELVFHDMAALSKTRFSDLNDKRQHFEAPQRKALVG